MKKTYLLSGICLLSFGLTACVNTTATPIDVTQTEPLSTEAKTEIVMESEVLPPCDDVNCVETDDFLTKEFTVDQGNGVVALSRPVSQARISVKDKKKEALQVSEEPSYAMDDNGGKPVVVLTKEVRTEETQVAKDGAPVLQDQPAKTDSQKEIKSESPKEEPKPEEIKGEEPATKETSADQNTTPDSEAASSQEDIISVSEQLIPLKKVRTTITETTTRIKDEPVSNEKTGDTLLDKIHYGEGLHDWEAVSGKTLHMLLNEWGEASGWTVVWKIDRDYILEAGVVFRGSFTDVSGALIRSFARATPAPIGTFYQGNRVLLITTQEDENAR